MAKNFVHFKGMQEPCGSENLVVRDLNLEVWAGKFLKMLGSSGPCKTTMPMMSASFETATHGEISLDGNHIDRPHKFSGGSGCHAYSDCGGLEWLRRRTAQMRGLKD